MKICKRGLEIIREKNQLVLITIICVPHLLIGVEPCHLPHYRPVISPAVVVVCPVYTLPLSLHWSRSEQMRTPPGRKLNSAHCSQYQLKLSVSVTPHSSSSVRSEPRLLKDYAHLDIKILTLFKDSFNILKLLIICHLSSNRQNM